MKLKFTVAHKNVVAVVFMHFRSIVTVSRSRIFYMFDLLMFQCFGDSVFWCFGVSVF